MTPRKPTDKERLDWIVEAGTVKICRMYGEAVEKFLAEKGATMYVEVRAAIDAAMKSAKGAK